MRLFIKLAISVAALVYAFYGINFSEFMHLAASINWFYILLAVIISMCSVLWLGYRWQHVLTPITESPLPLLIKGHFVGLFGNNIFPFRLGEFMRAYFIRKKLDTGYLKILGTIFIERMLDMLMACIIFGILLATKTLAIASYQMKSYAAVVAIVAVIIIIALGWGKSIILRIFRKRFEKAEDSGKWLDDLFSITTAFKLLVLSAILWTIYALRYLVVLTSLGLDPDLGLVALLLVATVVGFLIPAAPGAIGTYHMAVVFSMHTLYGSDLTTAQAAALFLHLTAYVPSTLIGFVFFLLSNEQLADIKAEQHAVAR